MCMLKSPPPFFVDEITQRDVGGLEFVWLIASLHIHAILQPS